jgi:divalent metal cation (Fe/Co/Zn/Cd) transporter
MSFSEWVALGQLIIAALGLIVAITGGVLAILGYRKVIKSTDENARIRRAEIEQAAGILQGIEQHFTGSIKRDKYTIVGFMLVIIAGSFWLGRYVFRVEERVKWLEQEKRRCA